MPKKSNKKNSSKSVKSSKSIKTGNKISVNQQKKAQKKTVKKEKLTLPVNNAQNPADDISNTDGQLKDGAFNPYEKKDNIDLWENVSGKIPENRIFEHDKTSKILNGIQSGNGNDGAETKEIPFTKDVYLDEMVKIGSLRHNKREQVEALKSWRQKAEKNVFQIPFEQFTEPFKLSLAEWLVFCIMVYNTLMDNRFSNSMDNLIDTLITSGLCHARDIRKLFSAEGNLLKNKLISSNGIVYKMPKEVYKRLFEISDNDNKNNCKDSFPVWPTGLSDEIKKRVIGQEDAVDELCAAVYEHYLRCKSGQTEHKNNVLLLGPTGTGKTFLCHTLAKILNVPFCTANITQYTEAGYIGMDIGDILYNLARKMPSNFDGTFPFSIVYIDEADKLRFGGDYRYDKGLGVQKELLKMLESEEYTCLSQDKLSRRGGKFNISKVLFILGGAFVGLEEIIAKRLNKHSIGFCSDRVSNVKVNNFKQVSSEDFAEYGFMPEMTGRISNRIALNPLQEKDLIRILKEGKESVLSDYRKLYEAAGIKLTVTEEELHKIASLAFKQGTGARGLAGIISKPLSFALYKTAENTIKEMTFTKACHLHYISRLLCRLSVDTQSPETFFEELSNTEGLDVCFSVFKEAFTLEVNNSVIIKKGLGFYFNAADFLIKKGLKIDDEIMGTAVTCGDVNLLKLFLDNGGNAKAVVTVSGTENEGNCTWPVLHSACIPDVPAECMKVLLKYGADINQKSSDGMSVFMWACMLNADEEKLNLLVKYGADINEVDAEGKTPLLRAEETCSQDVIKFLLAQGVNAEYSANSKR